MDYKEKVNNIMTALDLKSFPHLCEEHTRLQN